MTFELTSAIVKFLNSFICTGLPPSPPSAPSAISTIDDGPYTGQDNNGRVIKPIGVDVPRKRNDGIKGSMIAVIVLSAFTAFLLCVGFVWLLLLKCRSHSHKPEQYPQPLTSSPSKFTGTCNMAKISERRTLTCVDFIFSMQPCTRILYWKYGYGIVFPFN